MRIQQTFDYVVNDFKLDKLIDKLVVVGKRDLSEEINSSLDVALDRVIEKYGFLPSPVHKPDLVEGIGNVTIYEDKLDELRDLHEQVNDYRDKYDLPIDMSIEDIYQHMAHCSEALKNKLNKSIGGIYNETQKSETKKSETKNEEVLK